MRYLPTLLTIVAVAGLSASPAVAAPGDDGDLVIIDGGKAQVTLIGLFQGQFSAVFGDDALVENGDPAEEHGFRLRRARFGLGGTAYGNYDFELSVSAGTDGIKLLDAWVRARPLTSLSVTAGAHKVPFSRFALNSAGKSALNDRPIGIAAMAPFRQVGLSAEGDVGGGIFHWAAGVFNGFTRNASFYDGYVENSAVDGNRFTNVAIAARVEIAPLGSIGTGFADLAGGGARLGIGGGVIWDPGETVETLAWSVDALFKMAGFHFVAELIMDNAKPDDVPTQSGGLPTELDRMAVAAEIGYMLLPDQLGITVRGEFIDANTEVDDSDDSVVFTGGLQYYLRRHHLKAGLEFTHREELEGLSLDNDSLTLQVQFQL